MEKRLLAIAVLFICLQSISKSNDGNINFISPGTYELEYGYRTINIHFDPVLSNKLIDLCQPADITERKRYEIIKSIKDQLDLLPIDFLDNYVTFEILPVRIFDFQKYSFMHENQMIIDINKKKSGMSYKQSIDHALLFEVGKNMLEKNTQLIATKTLTKYLQEFYLRHSKSNFNRSIIESGFVSIEAAGAGAHEYSVSQEIPELFAHLICPESRERISRYLDRYPESILSEKVSKFVTYLEQISDGFEFDLINTSPAYQKAKFAQLNNELRNDELLTLHELRSNETYDFSYVAEFEEFEANSVSSSASSNIIVEDGNEDDIYLKNNEQKQIETLFNSQPPDKSKKKSKKSKRRKDGTGLLLVGSLVYLTLQILSQ